MQLVIVSGLSGSGKSVALHTLEDLGYYCVDNLPLGLLEPLARQLTSALHPSQQRAAVGIDARNHPEDLQRFHDILQQLAEQDITINIIFLQADDATLLKRFSETRRRHPLSSDETSLADAIHRERDLLEPISASAALHIDTTHTNIHQLRDLIQERVAGESAAKLSLLFKSFGFKHGVPVDADFVFDLRCLPNPHWQNNLRPLTGRDPAVAEFLAGQPGVERMFEQISRFLDEWIPQFEKEKRRYLTVALGCTGGQHRSVYLAERLGKHFSSRYPSVLVRHRELS
ncbi:RNase adapter RapZ [Thiohalobacter sp. IOR34]|uniref:RNase adapter RapZ n=1 Tax=Thiohalobacter sp. IOR34 TaxID=3057176 RepID=UPI0025AEFDDC|nr:RNase adapter RapZ [Thiohalobacter sp. IOR34]WJW74863.1 RNase adapter RapZ [Thiohalobacter sp. IOR34]